MSLPALALFMIVANNTLEAILPWHSGSIIAVHFFPIFSSIVIEPGKTPHELFMAGLLLLPEEASQVFKIDNNYV